MRPARRRGYHGNDARRRRVVRDLPSDVARRTICHPFENHGFLITSSPDDRSGADRVSQCITTVVAHRPRRRTLGGRCDCKEGGRRGRSSVHGGCERGLYRRHRRALFGFPNPQNRTSFRRAGAVRWSTRHPLSTFTRIPKHYARTHPHDTTCIRRHTGRALCPASSRRHRRRGITAGRDVVTAAAAAAGPLPSSHQDDEPAWIFNYSCRRTTSPKIYCTRGT